jgi:PAS domain S-box-containing protein
MSRESEIERQICIPSAKSGARYDGGQMRTDAQSLSGWTSDFVVKPMAISSFFVLLALLWTFPLQKVMAYPFVFLFFGAIMCSAWFGGFIAGSLAVVMSSVAIDYFFVPPFYSMTIGREFRSYVAAFVICAIAITAVSSARKKSETAVKVARDQLEIRVQERTAELQHSNSEILERERQLRELTEAIPQQIWRTDPSGSIEYFNRNLIDYLGRDARDLGDAAFTSILHPEDAPLFVQAWENARANGASFEVKARARGTTGNYRWFLIRGNPQMGAAGEIVCWYGVHIDIEEQQHTQQALLISQENLSRLSRTMSMAEMAASIAHELNQPLTALVADSHACRRWLNSEPVNMQRAIATTERIVRECTRASAVVSRVRALFTRSEYVREPTDLNRLIRDLVRLMRDDAIRRNVSIKLSLADNLPRLNLDPVQIQQVLLNLATNGMDAMEGNDGARDLEIASALSSADEVTVTVKDSGTGLEEETKVRVFEPFFSTKPAGTGMGLSICRSIIEAHQGRIWAENLPHGAAFHFTLGSNT